MLSATYLWMWRGYHTIRGGTFFFTFHRIMQIPRKLQPACLRRSRVVLNSDIKSAARRHSTWVQWLRDWTLLRNGVPNNWQGTFPILEALHSTQYEKRRHDEANYLTGPLEPSQCYIDWLIAIVWHAGWLRFGESLKSRLKNWLDALPLLLHNQTIGSRLHKSNGINDIWTKCRGGKIFTSAWNQSR